jgi:hypothetical protein
MNSVNMIELWDGRYYAKGELATIPGLVSHAENNPELYERMDGPVFPSFSMTIRKTLYFLFILGVASFLYQILHLPVLPGFVNIIILSLAIGSVVGVSIHFLGLLQLRASFPIEVLASKGVIEITLPRECCNVKLSDCRWDINRTQTSYLSFIAPKSSVLLLLPFPYNKTIGLGCTPQMGDVWTAFFTLAHLPRIRRFEVRDIAMVGGSAAICSAVTLLVAWLITLAIPKLLIPSVFVSVCGSLSFVIAAGYMCVQRQIRLSSPYQAIVIGCYCATIGYIYLALPGDASRTASISIMLVGMAIAVWSGLVLDRLEVESNRSRS